MNIATKKHLIVIASYYLLGLLGRSRVYLATGLSFLFPDVEVDLRCRFTLINHRFVQGQVHLFFLFFF